MDPIFGLVCDSVDPISGCAVPITDFLDPRPALFFTAEPISTLFLIYTIKLKQGTGRKSDPRTTQVARVKILRGMGVRSPQEENLSSCVIAFRPCVS